MKKEKSREELSIHTLIVFIFIVIVFITISTTHRIDNKDNEECPVYITNISDMNIYTHGKDTIYWCRYMNTLHVQNYQYMMLTMDKDVFYIIEKQKRILKNLDIATDKWLRNNSPEYLYLVYENNDKGIIKLK